MVTRLVQKMPDTNICGSCEFCRVNKKVKDAYLCWVDPPFPIDDAGNTDRGVEIDPAFPKCRYYQPRHNA